MNKAFIDTNMFYNILFETSLTQIVRKLLEDFEQARFYTSLTVVNELLYISTRKYYQTAGEIGGPYSLRKLIASKGYPELIINGIRELLRDLEVEVLVGKRKLPGYDRNREPTKAIAKRRNHSTHVQTPRNKYYLNIRRRFQASTMARSSSLTLD